LIQLFINQATFPRLIQSGSQVEDGKLCCGNDVKVVLAGLWNEVFEEGGFRGRTWGKRGKGVTTKYRGSHITLGYSGEIVSVNIVDGKVTIHEFSKTEETELGNEIRSILRENGLIE
jgi:hypothetical protein